MGAALARDERLAEMSSVIEEPERYTNASSNGLASADRRYSATCRYAIDVVPDLRAAPTVARILFSTVRLIAKRDRARIRSGYTLPWFPLQECQT